LVKSVQNDINNSTYGYKKELTQWAQSTASLKAYTDALNDQIAARQADYDIQIASMGLGDKESARAKQMAQLEEQVANNIERLNRARSQKGADQGLISAEIIAQQNSLPVLRQQLMDFWASQDAESSKWSIGWGDAMHDFINQASDVASQSQ
jgi:lambda family phage tail tape measure protein